jgi:hypothetical protein
MARQQEIKDLLCEVAPLLRSVAQEAQKVSAQLARTEWAKTNMVRDASLNQVTGTARWRMAGDKLVQRQGELPAGLEFSTTHEEQNQGRYYLRAPKLGIVLTIRRKPHKKDDEPQLLQLQIEAALEYAPVDYGDKIVVYLVVGPAGTEPQFDVVNRGEVIDSYRLIDLIKEAGGELSEEEPRPQELPGRGTPEPQVRSALDQEDTEEEAAGSEN